MKPGVLQELLAIVGLRKLFLMHLIEMVDSVLKGVNSPEECTIVFSGHQPGPGTQDQTGQIIGGANIGKLRVGAFGVTAQCIGTASRDPQVRN